MVEFGFCFKSLSNILETKYANLKIFKYTTSFVPGTFFTLLFKLSAENGLYIFTTSMCSGIDFWHYVKYNNSKRYVRKDLYQLMLLFLCFIYRTKERTQFPIFTSGTGFHGLLSSLLYLLCVMLRYIYFNSTCVRTYWSNKLRFIKKPQ